MSTILAAPALTAISPLCESLDMADPSVPQNKNPDQAQGPRALPQEGVLLRIFIGEDDRYEHRPLYEAIVFKARELHLAGATVLRGPAGFGRSSHIHTANILRLSTDLPMVIEIVDTEEKISSFLPHLDEMLEGGLVTMERVQVLHYREHERRGGKGKR
jgi:PII-like signaling protein